MQPILFLNATFWGWVAVRLLGGRMARLVAMAFVAALLAPVGVSAAPQDATSRALLAVWKDQDPSARLAAELIAGAFASGLSWGGKLDGKEA
jgi:hypothetical protein